MSGDYRRVRRNIEQITKASKRARDLVKQILMFSRKGEPGKKPLKLTPSGKRDVQAASGNIAKHNPHGA